MRDVAIFIPTCAIPVHPSTELIQKVLRSVRYWFADEPIYLACDGVARHIRDIPGRIENYEEYIKNVEALALPNVHIRKFDRWMHQTGMARAVLPEIQQRFLFFVEHDTVILDRDIHWDTILSVLSSEDANLVRLSYWEAGIHPEHEHMSLGEFYRDGVRFVRTSQFSGWPNIATTDFYRKMVDRVPVPLPVHFETFLYGPAAADPDWFKIVVYCPEGPCQRFWHLDGRRIEEGKRDPACEL
jgi:hypothetical protein